MAQVQPRTARERSGRAAATFGEARHSCPRCGQAFTLHYRVDAASAEVTTRVPCVADGCGAPVVVRHPRTAYAIWMEEF